MLDVVVSVVVTTKNEEPNIRNCLEAVRSQTYEQSLIEIIVVDNASTDSTKDIAREFTPLVFDHGPERSAQRNLGVEKARGKYVLYLDADMALSETVVGECVQIMEADSVIVGLYIPERIVGSGIWARVRDFERSFYNATVIDAVRFIRRDTFLQIGGFDENLCGPEDWDLDRRLNERGSLQSIESSLYHNEGVVNLKDYCRKKSYYIKDFDKYIEKWGWDEVTRKQFGAFYRFVGVFVERGKWKKIVAHPILFLLLFYLRLRVGLSYMRRRHIFCSP